jgi:hypothetical protein
MTIIRLSQKAQYFINVIAAANEYLNVALGTIYDPAKAQDLLALEKNPWSQLKIAQNPNDIEHYPHGHCDTTRSDYDLPDLV